MAINTKIGSKHPVVAMPLLLGPKNTEAAIGLPYRWLRDTAATLGVPFVGHGRKRAYRADLVIAALERGNIVSTHLDAKSPAVDDCVDHAEAVRRLLGKRRIVR